MKAQSSIEYLLTYGWALLLIIAIVALLYFLGLFDLSTYIQPSAEVVGFNSFNINRYILRSGGEIEIGISNLLEDQVTITQIWVDGSPVTGTSPSLPANLSAGANVTFTATSSLSSDIGTTFNIPVTFGFDVNRGTTDHFDSGFLRGGYQPN